MAGEPSHAPMLALADPDQGCHFAIPLKRINDGEDVVFFLASKAYADLMTFIFQLSISMMPRKPAVETSGSGSPREWKLNDTNVPCPIATQNIAALLNTLAAVIDEAPPDPGPRRFGNASFRTWHKIVLERVPSLLDQYLPPHVLAFKSTSGVSVRAELEAYLIGSFGSAQRLDYGTGHELSFLAFLACLWKLGAFPASIDGDQERGLVLGVFEPYLALVRRLILTYTLEPAGSHGVWGLDDHFFLPYIFGSAQFAPPITNSLDIAMEGSLVIAPSPADIVNISVVERERKKNMYFSAIGFIFDVKKGPFWEHSPILYDVSGVKAGWAKINKGMIKMYNAEVLSKFPVVQHFPFGSLLPWEKDPNAKIIEASIHTSSQPKSTNMLPTAATARLQPPLRHPQADVPLSTPQAIGRSAGTMGPGQGTQPTYRAPSGSDEHTRAPRATNKPTHIASSRPNEPSGPAPQPGNTMAPLSGNRVLPGQLGPTPAQPVAQDPTSATRAPWARK